MEDESEKSAGLYQRETEYAGGEPLTEGRASGGGSVWLYEASEEGLSVEAKNQIRKSEHREDDFDHVLRRMRGFRWNFDRHDAEQEHGGDKGILHDAHDVVLR